MVVVVVVVVVVLKKVYKSTAFITRPYVDRNIGKDDHQIVGAEKKILLLLLLLFFFAHQHKACRPEN